MSRPINGSDVFRAVAHPTRRRVLELLLNSEQSMGDIALRFRASQPTISRHLRVLEQAGLVTQQRKGRRRIYRLHPQRLRPLRTWLSRVR